MCKIGLFFGSFNPIHSGHLMLAGYILQTSDLDELWFCVSPLNPFKKDSEELTPLEHRFNMARIATSGYQKIECTDFEKELPIPSYTYQSLQYLVNKKSDKKFVLIIGGDNVSAFHLWKDYEKILEEFEVIAYPRFGEKNCDMSEKIKVISAPSIEISSTFIRAGIRNGKDMRYFLPEGVSEYIQKNNLYIK